MFSLKCKTQHTLYTLLPLHTQRNKVLCESLKGRRQVSVEFLSFLCLDEPINTRKKEITAGLFRYNCVCVLENYSSVLFLEYFHLISYCNCLASLSPTNLSPQENNHIHNTHTEWKNNLPTADLYFCECPIYSITLYSLFNMPFM